MAPQVLLASCLDKCNCSCNWALTVSQICRKRLSCFCASGERCAVWLTLTGASSSKERYCARKVRFWHTHSLNQMFSITQLSTQLSKNYLIELSHLQVGELSNYEMPSKLT